MDQTPAGWEGLLAPGEVILWQGRPEGGVVWADLIRPQTLFALFFTGFALFWMTGAWLMTRGIDDAAFSFFPLFGTPFLLVGLHMLIGRLFWDAYVRGRTWYTLTDRAAYTATEVFGQRKLIRRDFDEMTRLDLDDGQPGSVWFAESLRTHTTRSRSRSGARMGTGRTHTTVVREGFRRIPDARAVYRLIADRRDISASPARAAGAPHTP